MIEIDIKAEVKKAVALFQDKTYELSDLESHILTIIKENSEPAMVHKNQLERLIFKVDDLLTDLSLFWGGKKSKQVDCKEKGAALRKKIDYLLTAGGYSIDHHKGKAKDNSLFN